MNTFPKKYDSGFEEELYTYWESQGYFKPMSDSDPKKASKEKFVVSLPPPNVTGVLHIGHASMLAIEDTMVRFHRMLGYDTLWVPGTDHASISTQVVVERKLAKEGGKTKDQLGREAFLKKVRERVTYSRSEIIKQSKRMGSSLDWTREQFTMSETLSRAVRKAFKILFERGKIYQSTYMVNRSPGAQTVLSDLEVEMREEETKMYYIRYFVQGKGDSITVATVRPETIFADVAIAVHPKDRRYKKWIGKNVLIPIVNRAIPVIADESVQLDFGTGALKITPTHAEVDYHIAVNHGLPLDRYSFDKHNVYTTWAGEELVGKNAYDFFDNLIQHLIEIGNLEKVENYTTVIPYCERTGVRVQPLLSKQWFMNVEEAAKEALRVMEEKEVAVHPERFIKTFQNRLEDLKPRCISRQLRWGHRIPVWFDDAGESHVFDDDSVINEKSGAYKILSMIIFNLIADSRLTNPFNIEELIELLLQPSFLSREGRIFESYCRLYEQRFQNNKKLQTELHELSAILSTVDSEDHKGIIKAGNAITDILEQSCNIASKGDKYQFQYYVGKNAVELTQEEDVLDTWFSSGLWPFAILGRPEETPDLERFYPTTVLETGYDIIFFRVIRMMIMGHELTGQMPFSNVYFHGLVRDENGQKMSKSLGNVIDPLKLIEKYGTDAVRGALLLGNTPGNDQKFSDQKVDYVWRFLNKLWNASRFVASRVHNGSVGLHFSYDELTKTLHKHEEKLSEYDLWMVGKIQEKIQSATRYLQKFMLGDALQETIHLVRHDFCDRYIEIAKLQASSYTDTVMMYALGTFYKLLHPALPFVTEKLRSLMGFEGDLMISSWPEEEEFTKKNYRINLLMDMISERRTLKQQAISKPHEKVSIFVQGNKDIHLLVKDHEQLVRDIINVTTIAYLDDHEEAPSDHNMTMLMDIKLGVKGEKERNRKEQLVELEKKVQEEEQFLQRLRVTLASGDFVTKAPDDVVQEKRKKMEELKSKIAQMQYEINKLKMEHK